jgi:hypothetical protein
MERRKLRKSSETEIGQPALQRALRERKVVHGSFRVDPVVDVWRARCKLQVLAATFAPTQASNRGHNQR